MIGKNEGVGMLIREPFGFIICFGIDNEGSSSRGVDPGGRRVVEVESKKLQTIGTYAVQMGMQWKFGVGAYRLSSKMNRLSKK